jgi:hypothetical protein
MPMTKTNGAIAVIGFNELMTLIDCKIADIKYTKFAGRINCKSIALGRNVYQVYFVVSTLLVI